MRNQLGFSAYLSSFEDQRETLNAHAQPGTPVFLSLHISEEFSPDYVARVREMCAFLVELGYRIIADVSVKTVAQFGQPDLVRLAQELGLWALRVDYGFSVEEIAALAAHLPVVLNASTTTPEDAARIAQAGELVMAMHNFYPRPETGLDEDFFRSSTQALQAAGLKVLAFIPGDTLLRGPLHLGLPTLEHHRNLPPSVAFAQLALEYGVDGVFLADPGISPEELRRIRRLCEDGILEIPAQLEEPGRDLYHRVFTCRADSPAWLIRFAESREYSCFGPRIAPWNCVERRAGCITVDNQEYGRYSGEVQLLRRPFPADSKVNVIGQIAPGYLPLAHCVKNGSAFTLTPWS